MAFRKVSRSAAKCSLAELVVNGVWERPWCDVKCTVRRKGKEIGNVPQVGEGASGRKTLNT